MPSREEMEGLVAAHEELEERMTGAMWIRTDLDTAWLIEIIPEFPDDNTVGDPFVFTPSSGFRYSLHLIAGNLPSLITAVRQNPELAQHVVSGVALRDGPDVDSLLEAARATVGG